MSDVRVYYHLAPGMALIRPLGGYELGDMVDVPGRGPKYGDAGMPAFRGQVTSIEMDGMAKVRGTVIENMAEAA